ncbi:uncharacterized protein LOC132164938 [Corylus avellana]|uniref:uncharacterized protein LOC132164938 n=1 Tax=Corylus avellana TaxID=13451 RepID=UPI00286D1BA8|nr:uncharacterized protein LOC132164938 [Corylus avellana]
MYICLDAYKKGFKYGCRAIIFLDACHLKGEYGGQLLCAIGKDDNDDMFPTAFAMVEAETRESWLGTAVGLGTAIDAMLPHVEHRFCVRHLHANFKAKVYTGKAFKDELWGAARTSNIYAFDHHMQKILSMDKGAHAYLSGVPKASWSRHTFSCQTKSDMLLNNLTESFNAWIKETRSKPILTMVEDIHRQIMARFQQKKNGIRLTQYTICPKIHKKLETSKSDARNCIIYMHKQKSEEYLNGYYMMDKYMQGYAARVYSMESPNTWLADDPCNEILTPIIRRAPGRPKIARRKAADESTNPDKLTRSGYEDVCGSQHEPQAGAEAGSPQPRVRTRRATQSQAEVEAGSSQHGSTRRATHVLRS